MENEYYFSQGRLIPNNNTYNKFVDANNAKYIKNGNGDNDIEMGGTANTRDTKNTRDMWYNLSFFRPRKFQIFSASILRYK
jgi:hypothetical protein